MTTVRSPPDYAKLRSPIHLVCKSADLVSLLIPVLTHSPGMYTPVCGRACMCVCGGGGGVLGVSVLVLHCYREGECNGRLWPHDTGQRTELISCG